MNITFNWPVLIGMIITAALCAWGIAYMAILWEKYTSKKNRIADIEKQETRLFTLPKKIDGKLKGVRISLDDLIEEYDADDEKELEDAWNSPEDDTEELDEEYNEYTESEQGEKSENASL